VIVNLVIESDSFKALPSFVNRITTLLEKILSDRGCTAGEVNVVISDDRMLQELNLRFRKIDGPTDVLSFKYDDTEEANDQIGNFLLGDIFISHERAAEQANDAGHCIKREIAFLAVHGMLHLLGYDHHEDGEAEIMEQQERLIMNKYYSFNGRGNMDE
jgi:probable rRNA maturation factor